MNKLPLSFYRHDDVVLIARQLLGKYIFAKINGELSGGIIIETEAYKGPEDRGSHAYNNRRTPKNEMMYNTGGVVYMYICYGIHDMLNIVTGAKETSHAVLIRAIQPTTGLELMRQRRQIFTDDKKLCCGPGALTKALGLNKSYNGTDLLGNEIWVEDHEFEVQDKDIFASPRVGMNFDGAYKLIPWRFYIKGNPYVSRPHL
ncbi:MAG: DNA-3-methyladenine glycosylase [Daejeonella sp.]